jgi:hypothetical protein
MWKIRPTKNHECMKTFHPTLDEKKKKKRIKTLDEKSYIKIMDENLPLG